MNHDDVIPDNYELSLARLNSPVKQLRKEPSLLRDYNQIISEQLEKGIVETVHEAKMPKLGAVYYIPHQAVIRKQALTTRLRTAFDASSKLQKNLSSLNDCINTGPALMPAIMHILLRFRAWTYGLIADVEKAFRQVAIDETQRDYLRFLWLKDIETDNPELLVLRFCHVILGVNASPFLLNTTIKHHIEKYFHDDSEMAKKLLDALYVDDLSTGDNSVDNCFDLYQK